LRSCFSLSWLQMIIGSIGIFWNFFITPFWLSEGE
jgi:hypothetical protein